MDNFGQHMELTSRVALFKTALDEVKKQNNGKLTQENITDVAIFTKDSMNFETKGKWGRKLGNLYAFSTAILYDAKANYQFLKKAKKDKPYSLC